MMESPVMKYFALIVSVVFLCSCSSMRMKHQTGANGDSKSGPEEEVVQIPVDPDEPNVLPIDAENKEDKQETVDNDDQSEDQADDQVSTEDQAKKDTSLTSQLDEKQITLKNYPDIPHQYNRYVQKWLDYFQGRGSKYMARYLE
jgi:hypothetical protein